MLRSHTGSHSLAKLPSVLVPEDPRPAPTTHMATYWRTADELARRETRRFAETDV